MPSGIQNESSKLGYLESGRSIADWMRFTWAWGAWRSWARAGGGRKYLLRVRLETRSYGKMRRRENLVLFFGFYAYRIVGDCAGAAFHAVVDAVVAGAA